VSDRSFDPGPFAPLAPQPRPAFDGWLRLYRKDYAWAAEQLGRSREYIRLICLPFADPARRRPGGLVVENIIKLTNGAIRADDWHRPVAELLNGVAA